jgi:hypothetical protein
VSDPHVVSLRYRLISGVENVSFADNAAPVEDTTDAFSMRLDGGVVTFEMLEHHPTEESARRAVKPYLCAWEIDHALRVGRREFCFEFEDAEVIDREPPKPGEPVAVYPETGVLTLRPTVGATVAVIHGNYPKPPSNFAFDRAVETLWLRYVGYLKGREPLASMAYYSKTFVDSFGGGGPALGISRNVMEKLQALSSYAGGRKADGSRPFTSKEQEWLEATVKAIIRRVGEVAAGASPSPLTMSDLPAL